MAGCAHTPADLQLRLDRAHIQTVDLRDRAVLIGLDAQSTADLAELTTGHVGDRLQVVLDGKTIMSPIIRDPITSGQLQITLGNADDVAALYQQLKK